MAIFERKISEDISVSADAGYGMAVSLTIATGGLNVELTLEPDDMRDVALALIDAANAADTFERDYREREMQHLDHDGQL